jgi:hypothetical protein
VTVVEVVPLVAGTAPVIVGRGVVGAVVGVLGLLVQGAGLGVLDERLGVQVGSLLTVENSAHLPSSTHPTSGSAPHLCPRAMRVTPPELRAPASKRGRHELGAWRSARRCALGYILETIFTACGSGSTTTGAEPGRSRNAGAACPPQALPCAQQACPSPAPAHSPTSDAFFLTKSTI